MRGRVFVWRLDEHEVAGQGRLDPDRGRLPVADLTDEDDVRVGTEDGAQGAGEGQAGLVVDLHLVHARELVLDRVLDRDEVALGRVEHVQAWHTGSSTCPSRSVR